MEITKVKFKDGTLYYQYEVERSDGSVDEVKVKSHDAPLATFEEVWDMLPKVVVDEAELPISMANDTTVSSITISHYDDGRWGAVLSAVRSLENSNCPLVLNTPHKPAIPSENNPQDTMVLSESSVRKIEDVIRETEKYIRGERQQRTLQFAS